MAIFTENLRFDFRKIALPTEKLQNMMRGKIAELTDFLASSAIGQAVETTANTPAIGKDEIFIAQKWHSSENQQSKLGPSQASLQFPMTLEVSTPALLFPAISLLFLSFTNRFLHLSALVRSLHSSWKENKDDLLLAQIENLRRRLVLIRWMQLLGAVSLLLCVVAMLTVIANLQQTAVISFTIALTLMAGSLACLTKEIIMSGGALEIMLKAMEGDKAP